MLLECINSDVIVPMPGGGGGGGSQSMLISHESRLLSNFPVLHSERLLMGESFMINITLC